MTKEAIGLFFIWANGKVVSMNSIGLCIRTFIIFFLLASSSQLYAVDLGSFGDRIFQFQEKLAKGGNKLAQYKLGTLYEFGVSVEPNMEQARVWYEKSAEQGYQPAINRLTYLEVKQSGYAEDKHGAWFEQVLKLVDENEPDAMILLGQMNRYGIVVDQNLNLAVGLLARASSLGHTEVDSQIDELKREIRARKQQKKAAESRQEVVEKKPVKKKKPVKVANNKTTRSKANKRAEREAKRRRYEEAMRKLYRETLLLQQQQEWAESVPAVE